MWVLSGPSYGAKQLWLEVIKLYSVFKSSKMMHLVPELDSKTESLSGSFQLCWFRDKERQRENERESESLSTAPHRNRCVLQSACDPQSCRKEESAPSRREAGTKGRGVQCVSEMMYISSACLIRSKRQCFC